MSQREYEAALSEFLRTKGVQGRASPGALLAGLAGFATRKAASAGHGSSLRVFSR